MLDFEREQMEQELRAGSEARGIQQLPPVATKSQIRREIVWEVLFVAIPAILAIGCMLLYLRSASVGVSRWGDCSRDNTWLVGLLASAFAIVAAGLIWFTRIFATLILGRVAMGQGDTRPGRGRQYADGPAVLVFFVALLRPADRHLQVDVQGRRQLPLRTLPEPGSRGRDRRLPLCTGLLRTHIEVLGDLLCSWLGN